MGNTRNASLGSKILGIVNLKTAHGLTRGMTYKSMVVIDSVDCR